MLAFTKDTIPLINESLDFFNVMTYDLMNRRDNVTKHHTGIELSLDAIDAYLENGVPPAKANLGFAFYIKWFKTDPDSGCAKNPVGCRTPLMEDPVTGGDLGQGGGFSWHDPIPSEIAVSFKKALAGAKFDKKQGGNYYWDQEENIWWTWDTPEVISKKFPQIVEKKRLGGVFAWGLGEDAPHFKHLEALTTGVKKWFKRKSNASDSNFKEEL
jgi:GH18 family chitinase